MGDVVGTVPLNDVCIPVMFPMYVIVLPVFDSLLLKELYCVCATSGVVTLMGDDGEVVLLDEVSIVCMSVTGADVLLLDDEMLFVEGGCVEPTVVPLY